MRETIARAPITPRWLLLLSCLVLGAGCHVERARAPRPAPAQQPAAPSSAPLRSVTSFEAKLLAYNLLYQYRQIPRPDGSFPAWVCSMYPYVVDHPELRWEHRFPSIVATLEREDADILGLSEMRGGSDVSVDRGAQDPPVDPSHGPPVIRDVTRWMRNDFDFRYRWVSVWSVGDEAIVEDAREEREWLESECRPDMSTRSCAVYDVQTDHYSTKSYLAYRPQRFALVDAGAFELPTSGPQERRFAPWARLRERESGLVLLVVAVHLDPVSDSHRVDAARRIRGFLASHPDTPAAVLGDFNVDADTEAYAVLTTETEQAGSPVLVDAVAREGREAAGSALTFAVRDARQALGSDAPCWPRGLAGEGRRHVPEIDVRNTGRRTDYVFVTPGVAVLDAAVVTPVERVIDVAGERRIVHPSDHLPVVARVRVGSSGR